MYAAANMTLKLYFYTTTGDAAPDGDGVRWQCVDLKRLRQTQTSSVAGDNLDLNGCSRFSVCCKSYT